MGESEKAVDRLANTMEQSKIECDEMVKRMEEISYDSHMELLTELKKQTACLNELLRCILNITDAKKAHPTIGSELCKAEDVCISEEIFKKLKSDFGKSSLNVYRNLPGEHAYDVYGVLQAKVKKSKSADDYISIPVFSKKGNFAGGYVDVHGWVE